ncbi:MAG: MBL fold metallo-hydrolase [Elusimicrobia bacterium]|nr:MBL fold metallo-hydrolase [Elusimicrobiota bacterium]
MDIKIIFDRFTNNKKYLTGWGLSYLIDGKILFDTGENPKPLLKNMKTAGINISDIKTIVISHDHYDHTGGLWAILKENPKLKVYACPDFSKKFKKKVKEFGAELIENENFAEIQKNIYATGSIAGKYMGRYLPEQSLILKTPKGLTVLTGCAHPGIINIIENAKQNIPGNIYSVIGGFHLKNKFKKTIAEILKKFKELKIEKAAPSHCSGNKAMKMFKEKYGENFIEIKTGEEIEV